MRRSGLGVVRHHVKQALKVVRAVRLWQLLLIAIAFTVVALLCLRANSLEAVKYFDAVKAADLKGEGVSEALSKLQHYVTTHMNTDLERVSLDKSYDRDYQKAVAVYEQSGNFVDISAAEQEAIKACGSIWTTNETHAAYVVYSYCVADKLKSIGAAQDPLAAASLPVKELYEFHFLSPSWSPDLAGWMVLLAAVLWITILFKLLLQGVLYLLVRRYHR